MKILLCNDDGFGEPGLELLEAAARRLSDDVWVVAPDGKRTANSHYLTCGKPYDLISHDDRHFSCTGSPGDCVVAAMTHLFVDTTPPDLVVGGINYGRNVAEDAAYSGTLSIAREATFWGIPALGLSRPKTATQSASDADWVAKILTAAFDLKPQWHRDGVFLGINLPERQNVSASTAMPGRDKIAFRSDVVETIGNRTTLMVPRGRRHQQSDGDENTVLAAGNICVMRYDAFAQAPLTDGCVSAFSDALKS